MNGWGCCSVCLRPLQSSRESWRSVSKVEGWSLPSISRLQFRAQQNFWCSSQGYLQGVTTLSAAQGEVKSKKKCKLLKMGWGFLGKVSKKKLIHYEIHTMDPAEIAPVQAFEEKKPAIVWELRKVLGFISYHRPYIAKFSTIAKPLYSLLSPGKSTEETAVETKTKQKAAKSNQKQNQLPSYCPNNMDWQTPVCTLPTLWLPL